MTVKRKAAKRSIRVRRETISRISYTPPKLPDKPALRAKSYGRTKKGGYIIPRFVLGETYKKGPTKWWVLDMEAGNVAKKTNREGYAKKEEAQRVAREFGDLYGKWTVMPF